MIGGLAGIYGWFLRKRMHERHREPVKKKKLFYPFLELFKKFPTHLISAHFISWFEAIGFYLVALFMVIYAKDELGLNSFQAYFLNAVGFAVIGLLTISLGWIANKVKKTKIFHIVSALGVAFFSIPLFFLINRNYYFLALLFTGIIALFLTIQFALLPSLLVDLFPEEIRYTGIGISFNISDGVIGGITPVLAILVNQISGNKGAFVVLFLLSAITFLITLTHVRIRGAFNKQHKEHEQYEVSFD